ncbi:MAG: hypothetical protein EPO26_18545 [Chloroflexota bacterium]|nr:MAG: hypothetical protein EPO26_18545 [Chloroflexota bacterium]
MPFVVGASAIVGSTYNHPVILVQISRRAAIGAAAPLIGFLAACGAGTALGPTPTIPARVSDEWTPIIPATDLAVGRNRFLYAVLDERGRPILDARISLAFVDLADASPTLSTPIEAPFHGYGLGEKGVYIARADFAKAGDWGVEARIERSDGGSRTLRTRFRVKEASATPALGAPAPPSRQALIAVAADPRIVCTATPTCPLHDITIADALDRKRPALFVFSTPAYCTSAVCGPALDVVLAARAKQGDRITFAHLEIFSDGALRTPTKTVEEWGLPSEPWVFLVGSDGRIAEKLEGGITAGELDEALARLA